MSDHFSITVNGETRTAYAGLTVETLLDDLALDAAKIAVEINRDIIPKSNYSTQTCKPDDVVEIIHFIGGG